MVEVLLILLATPLDNLEIGAPVSAVERALGRVEWLDRTQPQAYRRGLIDTGLLEAINRAGAAPTRGDGAFDFSPLGRIGLAQVGDDRYVAIVDGTRLRYLFQLRSVPAHRDPWAKNRMARLKSALGSLSRYALRPAGKDRWGNTFQWKGRKGGAHLAVRYLPADDVLQVLMY